MVSSSTAYTIVRSYIRFGKGSGSEGEVGEKLGAGFLVGSIHGRLCAGYGSSTSRKVWFACAVAILSPALIFLSEPSFSSASAALPACLPALSKPPCLASFLP